MEEELNLITALFDSIRNHRHASIIYCLPPEIIIAVGSYLDDESLGAATRVCIVWHETLKFYSSRRKAYRGW
jgi:hypothetical protein